jgi:hypothetical protein
MSPRAPTTCHTQACAKGTTPINQPVALDAVEQGQEPRRVVTLLRQALQPVFSRPRGNRHGTLVGVVGQKLQPLCGQPGVRVVTISQPKFALQADQVRPEFEIDSATCSNKGVVLYDTLVQINIMTGGVSAGHISTDYGRLVNFPYSSPPR